MKVESLDVCVGCSDVENEDLLLVQLFESNAVVLGAWNQGDRVFFVVQDSRNLISNSNTKVVWNRLSAEELSSMLEIDSVSIKSKPSSSKRSLRRSTSFQQIKESIAKFFKQMGKQERFTR